MKRVLRLFSTTTMALLLSLSLTYAQTPLPSEALKLSQQNFSFGTARSAALGGAFTSLGADLASMNINPAGLGMYSSSDMGFTPSVTINRSENSYGAGDISDSKTQFSIGNIGAALNVYQGSGTLTSATIGFGYTKLADYNQANTVYASGRTTTIGEYFAEQLYGVSESKYLSGSSYSAYNQLGISQWGGILAYETRLLEPVSDDTYTPFGATSEYPNWAGPLSMGATVNPYYRTLSEGSSGEYTFSAGFNFSNILYLGFSFGLQDIYYRSHTTYSETYNDNDYNLNGMSYYTSTRIDGVGVNGKFGLILQPIPNFRLGLSLHTPTAYSLDHSYTEAMGTEFSNTAYEGLLETPTAVNNYRITTPTRLSTGISYSLPGVGLITADYERVWYNGMRLRDTGYYQVEEDFKSDVTAIYQAANNVRAGLELTPTNNFFLRGGYAYYGDCMQYSDLISTSGLASVNSYYNISAGIGYRFGSTYLDLSYIYTNYNLTPYNIFYYEPYGAAAVSSGDIYSSEVRHTISLTMGMRF